MTPTVALVVKLIAKSDTTDEVASFLTSRQSRQRQGGHARLVRVAHRRHPVLDVDAFPSDTERQAHPRGPIAAALMANADRLLAQPPEINPADVHASKVARTNDPRLDRPALAESAVNISVDRCPS